MKNLKTLLLLPGVLVMQNVFGQSTTHLQLSDQYPAAGKKITVTYDPAGTPLENQKNLEAVVYYMGDKAVAEDLNLKANGKVINGELSIPDSVSAFFVKISADDKTDNNNDKGYFYLIYKDKQPVKSAYSSEAYFISSGMGAHFVNIKSNNDEGIALYKKEFELYPKSEKENAGSYYFLLNKKPENKELIYKKIAELEQSKDETDLMTASNILRTIKNTKAADSINAVIKTKFPNGMLAKNEMGNTFYREKDPAKKEELYTEYLKKYPEDIKNENTTQDNFRLQLAAAYLEKGDLVNYKKYESQVKNKYYLNADLNNVAYEWAKKNERLEDAEKLAKEALEIVQQSIDHPKNGPYMTLSEAKKMAQNTYDGNADSYAFILAKEKKYREALEIEQPVIDHLKVVDPDEYMNYVNILTEMGQYQKAKEAAEKAITAGQGSDAIKADLKRDYVKLKGSDAGFDEYVTSLEKVSKDKAMADLAKTMINKPAPIFTLKDMDGKSVSLADLKGKVVIVDFWATWCGPCKASFPGMQLAVNKYKDDPNVKFLFVDCWENGDRDKYVEGVKKFIANNKYTFNVLIDEKGDDGKQSKVVSSYGVEGIPTKFIIDKNGNIRFQYVGYLGTPEKLLDEVVSMINMAGNPEATTVVATKVSSSK